MPKTLEDMYWELYEWYQLNVIGGAKALEKDLKGLESKGLTREEAIKSLYVSVFGRERFEVPREDPLEASFQHLRRSGAWGLLLTALLTILTLIAFLASPSLGVLFIIFLALSIGGIAGVQRRRTVPWSFSETLKFDGMGWVEVSKVAEETVKQYSEFLVEDLKHSLEGSTLTVEFPASTKVLGDEKQLVTVDLGLFRIKATFSRSSDDLVVNVAYSCAPPEYYAEQAAEAFRKYVKAFRLSLKRAVDEVAEKAEVYREVASLLKAIESKGIIIREVKCPRCGAPVEIPRKGHVTRCRYCGATITISDIRDILRSALDSFRSS